MARIAGVDIPGHKTAEVALTRIYGIGMSTSRLILTEADLTPEKRIQDLTDQEITRIRNIIEKEYSVEGDLRKEVATNIKRLMDIGSYRGSRHKRGLPVRGQRTNTNARTRKGPKKTVGARKKEGK